MINSQELSNNKKRNNIYHKFLLSPNNTVNSVIKMANRLMRKEKLHRNLYATHCQIFSFFCLESTS